MMHGPNSLVYLSGSVVPSRAANSIHVMKMAHAMAVCGLDVTLVCKGGHGREPGVVDVFGYYGVEPGFSLVQVGGMHIPGHQLLYAWRSVKVARRYSVNGLVYCRDIWSCWLAAEQGMYVAFEAHSMDMFSTAPRRFAFGRIINAKRFRFIVVISRALERDLLKSVPQLKGRTMVAHDAADVVPDGYLALAKGKGGGFQVGYTGHLYRGRGIGLILDIAACCQWATFHIVGGNASDIERLRGQVLDRRLTNVVIHGFVVPGRLNELRSTLDAVLAPYEEKVSVGDNVRDTARWMSPMKIFEYMASGLPIICSDLPVLREVLTDNETALLVMPNNPVEWVAALERLRDDRALRERIALNAARRQRAEFSWLSRAKSIVDFSTSSSCHRNRFPSD